MTEIFKPIRGYEGLYEISNLGRVKALDKIVWMRYGGYRHHPERLMKLEVMKLGYVRAQLHNGVKRKILVHLLVADAFLPPKPDGHEINHKDGNKANNRADNLEWSTKSDNIHHSYKVIGRKQPDFYKRRVQMFSKDGILLAEYESLKEASESVGISKGTICSACRGKYATVKNHIWKYA